MNTSIKKEAVRELVLDYAYAAADIIKNIPAVDVTPVVHGRWEPGNPICPICGENKFKELDADIWSDWQPPCCPNCGAKMDGNTLATVDTGVQFYYKEEGLL